MILRLCISLFFLNCLLFLKKEEYMKVKVRLEVSIGRIQTHPSAQYLVDGG